MKKFLTLMLIASSYVPLFSQSVDLPAAQKTGGMPLMEALSKRSTARAFDTKELSMQQISDLLWAGFGINRPDGKRTAPSARDFQETDIYVLMKQGTYLYDAKANKLQQISSEDVRALGGQQAFVKDAPVTLILVSNLSKMGNGDKEGKLNTANIDAGYISQNIYLYCASAGLVTGARMSIDKNALSPKLKLNENQVIIIAHSVGYQKQ